jgi:hypothetical protein
MNDGEKDPTARRAKAQFRLGFDGTAKPVPLHKTSCEATFWSRSQL